MIARFKVESVPRMIVILEASNTSAKIHHVRTMFTDYYSASYDYGIE